MHKQQDMKEPTGTRSYTGSSLSPTTVTVLVSHTPTTSQRDSNTAPGSPQVPLLFLCLCFPLHHGAVSARGPSRQGQSPLVICWQLLVWCSPRPCWLFGLQAPTAASHQAFHPPVLASPSPRGRGSFFLCITQQQMARLTGSSSSASSCSSLESSSV